MALHSSVCVSYEDVIRGMRKMQWYLNMHISKVAQNVRYSIVEVNWTSCMLRLFDQLTLLLEEETVCH